MSTNGTIKFIDRFNRNVLNIYTHYDSYYTGVGELIYNFFKDERNFGNGLEDTALLFVCHIKEGKPYSIYATDKKDKQEYNYEIYETKDGLRFTIIREDKIVNGKMKYKNKLWRGTIEEFKKELDTERIK